MYTTIHQNLAAPGKPVLIPLLIKLFSSFETFPSKFSAKFCVAVRSVH